MGAIKQDGYESWAGNQGVNLNGVFGKGISPRIKGWSGALLPDDVKTSAEALAAAGLDWEVDRHPILAVTPQYGVDANGTPGVIGWEPVSGGPGRGLNGLPTGGFQVIESHIQNVRRDTGKTVGVVGSKWTGIQNHETFRFVDDLIDSGDAKWVAGGSIGGGRKVWAAAQVGREVIVGGDEDERALPFLFVSNGWDGGTAFTISTGLFRLICLNGLAVPVKGAIRQWRGRHTTNVKDRLQVARKALELNIGYVDTWQAEMEKLLATPLSTKQVEDNVKILFPDPKPAGENGAFTDRQLTILRNKREGLLDVYRDAPDLQNITGTAYGFINAVAEYVDWHGKFDAETQILGAVEPNALKDQAFELVSA